jgi:hypothetical protein
MPQPTWMTIAFHIGGTPTAVLDRPARTCAPVPTFQFVGSAARCGVGGAQIVLTVSWTHHWATVFFVRTPATHSVVPEATAFADDVVTFLSALSPLLAQPAASVSDTTSAAQLARAATTATPS